MKKRTKQIIGALMLAGVIFILLNRLAQEHGWTQVIQETLFAIGLAAIIVVGAYLIIDE